MLKIISISLVSLILSSLVKSKQQEISVIISVSAGVLILMQCFEMISSIVDFTLNISSNFAVDSELIKLALKIIGVGYVVEFAADIADDFGNKIISSKIILAGKVVICYLTLPIIKNLFMLLLSFV